MGKVADQKHCIEGVRSRAAAGERESGTKAGCNKDAAALRRQLFVQAYIATGGNKSRAAKAAGFSEHTAHAQGSRLFNHVEVQALIAAESEKLAHKHELHADMVVRGIVQELNFDPRRLFHPDGRIKSITEIDEDTVAALQGFEVTETTTGEGAAQVRIRTIKVKWAPKALAREQAMKHLGMFKADNAQRSTMDGVPRQVLLAIADRLKKQYGRS